MDLLEAISETNKCLASTAATIALNEKLLRTEPPEIRELLGYVNIGKSLAAIKEMLLLRQCSLDLLTGFKNTGGLLKVNYQTQEIAFPFARFFSVEAFLTSTWSIYDILVGHCSTFLCGQSIAAREPNKSPSLKSLFIRFKNSDAKYSPHIVVSTLTCDYDLEIEYFYKLRNIFVHSAGTHFTDIFLEQASGKDCFQLTPDALLNFKETMDLEIKQRNEGHPLLTETDLLEIFKKCVKKVDDALCLLLRTSAATYSSLIGGIVISKGGKIS